MADFDTEDYYPDDGSDDEEMPPEDKKLVAKHKRVGEHQSLRYMLQAIYNKPVGVINGRLMYTDIFDEKAFWSRIDSVDIDLHTNLSLYSLISLFMKDSRLASIMIHAKDDVRSEISQDFTDILIAIFSNPRGDTDYIEDHMLYQDCTYFMRERRRLYRRELKPEEFSIAHAMRKLDQDFIKARMGLDAHLLARCINALTMSTRFGSNESRIIAVIKTCLYMLPRPWRQASIRLLDNLTLCDFKQLSTNLCTESWIPMLDRYDGESRNFRVKDALFTMGIEAPEDSSVVVTDDLVSEIESHCFELYQQIGQLGRAKGFKKLIENSSLMQFCVKEKICAKAYTEQGGIFQTDPKTALLKLLTEIMKTYDEPWPHLNSLVNILRPDVGSTNFHDNFGDAVVRLKTILNQHPLDEEFHTEMSTHINPLMWKLSSDSDTWSMICRLKGLIGEYNLSIQHNVKWWPEPKKRTLRDILTEYSVDTDGYDDVILSKKPDGYNFTGGTIHIYEFGWCFARDWKRMKDEQKWENLPNLMKALGVVNWQLNIVTYTTGERAANEHMSDVIEQFLYVKRLVQSKYPKTESYITLIECTIDGYRNTQFFETMEISMPDTYVDAACEIYRESFDRRGDLVVDLVQNSTKREAHKDDIYRMMNSLIEDVCDADPATFQFKPFDIDSFELQTSTILKLGGEKHPHNPKYDTLCKFPIARNGDKTISDDIIWYISVNPLYKFTRDNTLIFNGWGKKIHHSLRRLEMAYMMGKGAKAYIDFNSCFFVVSTKSKQVNVQNYHCALSDLLKLLKGHDRSKSKLDRMNDSFVAELRNFLTELESPTPLLGDELQRYKSVSELLMSARGRIMFHPALEPLAYKCNPKGGDMSEPGWCVVPEKHHEDRYYQLVNFLLGSDMMLDNDPKTKAYTNILSAWFEQGCKYDALEDQGDRAKIREFENSMNKHIKTATLLNMWKQFKELKATNLFYVCVWAHGIAEAAESINCQSVEKSVSSVGVAKIPGFHSYLLLKKHKRLDENHRAVVVGFGADVETTIWGQDWSGNVSRPFFIDSRLTETMLSLPGILFAMANRICTHSGMSYMKVGTTQFRGLCEQMVFALKDSAKMDEQDSVRRYWVHGVLMDYCDMKIYSKLEGPFRSYLEVLWIKKSIDYIRKLYEHRAMFLNLKMLKAHDTLRSYSLPAFYYEGTTKIHFITEEFYCYYMANKQHGSTAMAQLEAVTAKSVNVDVEMKKTEAVHGIDCLPLGFCLTEPLDETKLSVDKTRLPYDYTEIYSAAYQGALNNRDTIVQSFSENKREYTQTLAEMKNSSHTISNTKLKLDFEERKERVLANRTIKNLKLNCRLDDGEYTNKEGQRVLAQCKEDEALVDQAMKSVSTSAGCFSDDLCFKVLCSTDPNTNDLKNALVSLTRTMKKKSKSFDPPSGMLRKIQNLMLFVRKTLKEMMDYCEDNSGGKKKGWYNFQDLVWRHKIAHTYSQHLDSCCLDECLFWQVLCSCFEESFSFLLQVLYSLSVSILTPEGLIWFIQESANGSTEMSIPIFKMEWVHWSFPTANEDWDNMCTRHRQYMQPNKSTIKILQQNQIRPYSVELDKLSNTMTPEESRSMAYVGPKLMRQAIDSNAQDIFVFLPMAKRQHAGKRDIYTTTAKGKVMMRLAECITTGIGKGICGEVVDVMMQNNAEKKFTETLKGLMKQSNHDLQNGIIKSAIMLMGSEDCASWGPTHDPIAFLVTMIAIDDALDIMTADELNYLKCVFILYTVRRKILIPDAIIDKLCTAEPHRLNDKTRYLHNCLMNGEAFWVKDKKDMLQGIPGGTSSCYMINKSPMVEGEKNLVQRVTGGKVVLTTHDVQSSDDAGVGFMLTSDFYDEGELHTVAHRDIFPKLLEFRRRYKRRMNVETSNKSSYCTFINEFKSQWLFGSDEHGTSMAPTIKFTITPTRLTKILTADQHYIAGFTEAAEVLAQGGVYMEACQALLERLSQFDVLAGDQIDKIATGNDTIEYRYNTTTPLFCGSIPLPGPSLMLLGSVQHVQDILCTTGPILESQLSEDSLTSFGTFKLPLSKLERIKKKNTTKLIKEHKLNLVGATFDDRYDNYKVRYFPIRTADEVRMRFEQGMTRKTLEQMSMPKASNQYRRKVRAIYRNLLWRHYNSEEMVRYVDMARDLMSRKRKEPPLGADHYKMMDLDGMELTGKPRPHLPHFDVITSSLHQPDGAVTNSVALVGAIYSCNFRENVEEVDPSHFKWDLESSDKISLAIITAKFTDSTVWHNYSSKDVIHALFPSDLRVIHNKITPCLNGVLNKHITDSEDPNNEFMVLEWSYFFKLLECIVNQFAKSRRKNKYFILGCDQTVTPITQVEIAIPKMLIPSTAFTRLIKDRDPASYSDDKDDETHALLGAIDLYLSGCEDPNSDENRKVISTILHKKNDQGESPVDIIKREDASDSFSNRATKFKALLTYSGIQMSPDFHRKAHSNYSKRVTNHKAIYSLHMSGQNISLIRDRKKKKTVIKSSSGDKDFIVPALNKVVCNMFPEETDLGLRALLTNELVGENTIEVGVRMNQVDPNGTGTFVYVNTSYKPLMTSAMHQTGNIVYYEEGCFITTIEGNYKEFDTGVVPYLMERLVEAEFNEEAEILCSLNEQARQTIKIPIFTKKTYVASKYTQKTFKYLDKMINMSSDFSMPRWDLIESSDDYSRETAQKLYKSLVRSQLAEEFSDTFLTDSILTKEVQRELIKLLLERANLSSNSKSRLRLSSEFPTTLESLLEEYFSWMNGAYTESRLKALLMYAVNRETPESLYAERFAGDVMDTDIGRILKTCDKAPFQMCTRTNGYITLTRYPVEPLNKFRIHSKLQHHAISPGQNYDPWSVLQELTKDTRMPTREPQSTDISGSYKDHGIVDASLIEDMLSNGLISYVSYSLQTQYESSIITEEEVDEHMRKSRDAIKQSVQRRGLTLTASVHLTRQNNLQLLGIFSVSRSKTNN